MPITTNSPGRATHHSGVYPDILVLPNIREDGTWISQWKFDDISAGTALDSQNSNTLTASGSPTQVAGNRQSSGVEFDGVDDAFYMQWADGSGLSYLVRTAQDVWPGNPDGVTQDPAHDPNWGFMCSLRCDDFSEDKVIMSKWNEVGADRHWMVGINPSGGVFFQMRRTTGTTVAFNSHIAGLIPSGQWVDFAFCYLGIDSTSSTVGPGFAVMVDDNIVVESYGSVGQIEEAASSGLICVGSADIGLSPSGFFKGRMEDLRFFNGSYPGLPAMNAFKSGVSPLTTYPNVNDLNQYIGAHFQMNELPSGVVGHLDTFRIEERKHQNHVFGSGAQFRESSVSLRPGAADGTFGSGIEHIGNSSNQGTAMFARAREQFKPNTLAPKGSHTWMCWIRPEYSSTTFDPVFAGFRHTSVVRGPWNAIINNMQFQYGTAWDHDQRLTYGSNAGTVVQDNWIHLAAVANLEQERVDLYISGVWVGTDSYNNSGMWLKECPTANNDGFFRMFYNPTNTTAYGLSGILDEMILINYPLTSGQVAEFYANQSGFLNPAARVSGVEGGFIAGVDVGRGSGAEGGYVAAGIQASGSIGAWMSGIPLYQSGIVGAFIEVGTSASGTVGAYLPAILDDYDYFGGWIRASGVAGGYEGGYLRGVEPVDQAANFAAFYNIIGRDKQEFDAQVKVAKSLGIDFDAMAVVYKDERKPTTSIINPNPRRLAAKFVQDNLEELNVPFTSAPELDSNASGFTWAMWIKPSSVFSDCFGALSSGSDVVYLWGAYDSAGTKYLYFQHYDDAAGNAFAQTTFNENTDTFIVGRYSNKDVEVSVNNSGLVASFGAFAGNPKPGTANHSFRLGGRGIVGVYTDTAVQDMAIWHRAINVDEITQLYNGGRGLAYDQFTPNLKHELKEYWYLNEEGGDRTGVVNNIVLTDNNTVTNQVSTIGSPTSGDLAPISYEFEATASGLDGKSIYRTWWFFSDDTSTSGSEITSSGTYRTEHTFAQSGIFDVLFVAMDEKGIINSSRMQINTASGYVLPEISLEASPASGSVPLEVAFSGIISSAPVQILDEYIYFGDGTRTASTQNILKMYPVIGCYIPVYRVRDASGYIVTDTTFVGVNN